MKHFPTRSRKPEAGSGKLKAGRMRVCLSALLLLFAPAVLATIPLYENDAVLNYTCPPDPIPTIDATNFVNNSSFTINFMSYSTNTEFYEPWNTINYTNNGTMNGTMTINTGFKFDTLSRSTGLHSMAGSFYNSGTISCGSFLLDTGTSFFSGYGQFIASATNLVNPGTIEVGPNDFIQLTGQNVDLSDATLTIEQNSAGLNLNASGAVGTDTNGEWNPNWDLQPNYANSSWSGGGRYPAGNYLDLTNTTPYLQEVYLNESNIIVQMVFIQNDNINIPYNVYFGPVNLCPDGTSLGNGEATVEWVGFYVDPATGNPVTSYLYLNDDYILGAATNVVVGANGLPNNFTFTPRITNQFACLPGAAGIGGFNFSPEMLTNRYAYFNAQLIPTTMATNASASNPSGALTNLTGRIQITASGELNLALAQITGPNYMSLTATNQFDGSGGAAITTPYADLNLGVTNGFMTVSNLLAAIPNWNGTVQAWSTRWTNTVTGTNWDFQVLIVHANSQLSPVTVPTVQNLRLHATNIVISDVLNVIGTFYADAQNLTLTTNGYGNGATSPDGELNLENNAILWPSALPNLLNLTNNGAITTMNLALFGSGAPTYTTNITPAIAATGMLSETTTNANVPATNTVTIGTYKYVFVNKITNTVPNQVKIAATFDGSMSNLITAINNNLGSGINYSTNVTTNTLVTAGLLANHSFAVTARTAGLSGNSVATTTSTTNLTWGSTTLSGGVDAVTNVVVAGGPYGAFINNGLVSDQGSQIYATNFENSGVISNGVGSFLLQSQNVMLTNGSIIAGGGVTINSGYFQDEGNNISALGGFSVTTSTGKVENASITAGQDVDFTAGFLKLNNSTITAGRQLNFSVTNSLYDTLYGSLYGIDGSSSNMLICTNGFDLAFKPATGDLLGTTINSITVGHVIVNHIWAATDFGPSVAGFSNNVAIGKLVLTAVSPSPPPPPFHFIGTSTTRAITNALYVDYLDLSQLGASYSNMLNIDTNIIIYYAAVTNIGTAPPNGSGVAQEWEEYLNGQFNNHLRWVTNFAGPNSSMDVLINGQTYLVNRALRYSKIIDSNGNGIPNYSDPAPFSSPPPGSIPELMLKVSLVQQTGQSSSKVLAQMGQSSPTVLAISWLAAANTIYQVEFATNLPLKWQPLLAYTNNALTNQIVTVFDASAPAGAPRRFYRVGHP